MLSNNVQSLILKTHGVIREITGGTRGDRFGASLVLQSIIGIAPRSPGKYDRLLVLLQRARRAAQLPGFSVLTISAAAYANRSGFPAPVELTRADPDQAAPHSRLRVPAQVKAHVIGVPPPIDEADAGNASGVEPWM